MKMPINVRFTMHAQENKSLTQINADEKINKNSASKNSKGCITKEENRQN
jgi:hypothetical protein